MPRKSTFNASVLDFMLYMTGLSAKDFDQFPRNRHALVSSQFDACSAQYRKLRLRKDQRLCVYEPQNFGAEEDLATNRQALTIPFEKNCPYGSKELHLQKSQNLCVLRNKRRSFDFQIQYLVHENEVLPVEPSYVTVSSDEPCPPNSQEVPQKDGTKTCYPPQPHDFQKQNSVHENEVLLVEPSYVTVSSDEPCPPKSQEVPRKDGTKTCYPPQPHDLQTQNSVHDNEVLLVEPSYVTVSSDEPCPPKSQEVPRKDGTKTCYPPQPHDFQIQNSVHENEVLPVEPSYVTVSSDEPCPPKSQEVPRKDGTKTCYPPQPHGPTDKEPIHAQSSAIYTTGPSPVFVFALLTYISVFIYTVYIC